ncbi:DUF1343 domain-containing protein [Inquilinus sp. CAU 1745]|uniref:exo-beta-N-acetylmuramidase NamZ family protein n=1 Tax=Inquilinus sp. CAU 1745 TaxID=3140369 RepID=UPI00325A818D
MSNPILGVDRLEAFARLFEGRRLGLVANHASRDSNLVPTWDRLKALKDARLERLFSPEHGLHGVLQDGEKAADGTDGQTGLPVISLYGPRLTPETSHFEGLDAIVYDIQDVGVRAYTYLATLLRLCAGAAEAGIDIIILDRPNPLGRIIEGGGVAADSLNFVAPMDAPLRHGLTLGEIARLHCAENALPPPTVAPCEGWTGEPVAPDRRWLAPSPNLPTSMAALAYPGTVLVEGTGLSEGRGTTRPFTTIGAPGLDGVALADRLSRHPGLEAWATWFRPSFSKHAGTVCDGVELYIADRRAYRALPVALDILAFVRDEAPDALAVNGHLALLAGGPALGEWLECEGAGVDDMLRSWEPDRLAFAERARPHRLYGSCP